MGDFKNSSINFLTGADFQDNNPERLKDTACAIVLFYADWCGHCNNFKPIYAKFSDAAQFINVAAVDVVANRSLMERLEKSPDIKIEGYPTLVKYSNGKPIGNIKDRDYPNLMSEAMSLCNKSCRCGEM